MKIKIRTNSDTDSDIDRKILSQIINILAEYKANTVTLDYEGFVYFRDD